MNADRKRIQTTLVREWKERWQREVNRSRARHRGRAAAEEPADEPPTKERLKLHDGLQKAESSLLASPDENRQDRTPSLPVRTSGAGCDDSMSVHVESMAGKQRGMWQHILPAGGDNKTGVAVRDTHAPRLRDGGKGPYQGGQPDSVAHAEAASGWI